MPGPGRGNAGVLSAQVGLAGLGVTRLGAKPFSAQVGFASITFGVDAGMIKAPERKTIKNTLHQNGTGNEQVNPCTPDLMPTPPCRKASEKRT